MLSPVLFNIHHTGTAGCSLRIHSKARKFIQHMRSKCANCSWMLMALKSLGKHKFWMVDIICLPTDIERYPIRKLSVHRPPKPCAALDLLAWLPRIFLKLETSCTWGRGGQWIRGEIRKSKVPSHLSTNLLGASVCALFFFKQAQKRILSGNICWSVLNSY